ncbi:MAG: hypothetical protein JO060_12070 [Candidatus Eremiobacteraeota bacterium]|nr:hypothetical protein [Candidatus Eremiobacteraeota bacterium]
MRKRFVLAVVSCAVAFCGAFVDKAAAVPVERAGGTMVRQSTAPVSHGFVAGHLFVGTAGVFGTSPIWRYPIHNGVPAKRPDLVYPNLVDPQFTVTSDGSLFGVGRDSTTGNWDVNVFRPNSTKVERRLQLPTPLYITYYNGIAVDPSGYLYADYNYTGSRGTGRHAHTSSNAGSHDAAPCNPPSGPWLGILVYAPGAEGTQNYTICYQVNEVYSQYEGLAIDSRGSLYVPDQYPPSVGVYATPNTNPTLIRTVSGPAFQSPTSIALDAQDRMWVMNNSSYYYGYSYVARYQPYANGTTKPEGILSKGLFSPLEAQWCGNIAVDDEFLYVGENHKVLVYHKFARNAEPPFAILSLPQASGCPGPWVAVGP